MAQLNTRIVLRNDTTAAWLENSSQVLMKGEIGIEFDPDVQGKVKMKIGDGVTAWSELEYFGGETSPVHIGDEVSIDTADGKFQIHNFGKEYYKYVPPILGEDGQVQTPSRYELTEGFKEGLEPRVILNSVGRKLEIAWYEPSSETIEGVSSKVESLNKTVGDLQTVITAPETGLVSKVLKVGNDLKTLTDSVYTKDATDAAITVAIAKAPHLKRVIVETLPVSEIDQNTIYMILKKSSSPFEDDKYTEYMYLSDKWERLGDSTVDLAEYAKKTEVTTEIDEAIKAHKIEADNNLATELKKYATTEALTEGLSGKVDIRVDADLLLNTDKAKIDALKVVDGAVQVEASNVNGLTDWVTSQRDTLAGLFSTTNAEKLGGVENGAQKNILESIKMEGSTENLIASEKTITIPKATNNNIGVVKLSEEVGANFEGGLEVKSLNINKLIQNPEETLILDGGGAVL